VSLIVGPDATPFTIHNTVLGQSAVLAAKLDPGSMAKQHMLLPELDETTAHTLVHYMYTGKYQCLQKSPRIETSAISGYQAGTCVYCAAARYQLAELIDLAKEKILSFGKEVGISDVLAMARDHAFPLLPEDDTWYPAYLEDVIKSAMAKDPEPFRRPEFITQVEGSSRLLQVVWKTVVNNYASATVVPQVKDDTPIVQAASDGEISEVKDIHIGRGSIADHHPPASVDGSQTTAVANDTAADSPSPAGFSETLHVDDVSIENSLKLDDIEPTIEAPQALDAFTDELGFEKSKTYQRMSKNEIATEPRIAMGEEPQKFPHQRSDSVIQADEDAMLPAKKVEIGTTTPVEEAEKAETDSTTAVDGSVEGAQTSKKSKKRSKKEGKKKSSIVF
jgi:hypothetical protein